MGIRSKTIFVVAVILCSMGAALVGGAYTVASRAATDSERSDMQGVTERAASGIRNQADSLRVIVLDWAQWDDTYYFLKGTSNVFREQDLTPDTLKTLDVDFIVVTDKNGRTVASVARDTQTMKVQALPAEVESFIAHTPALTHFSSIDQSATGLVGLPSGPAVISAAAVSNSNADAPVDGAFIAGRYLSSKRVAAISQLTMLPLEVYSLNAKELPDAALQAAKELADGQAVSLQPEAGDQVAGYTRLRGIDGAWTVLVRVEQPRTSVVLARNALTQFVVAATVLLVIILALLGWLLDFILLNRLGRLNADVARVGAAGDPSARVDVRGRDEIAAVAESVNGMLGQIEASQTDLAYLANHDPLTRLYNRRRFEAELNTKISAKDSTGALLWFDLDHFKEVNDSLGHAAGDDLLAQLADVLAAETRGYSVLARLGGDEFGILVPGASETEAVSTAERLLETLTARIFCVADHEVRVGASVGVVTYPCEGESADDLLARADLAMYQAKDTGRNRVVVYTCDEDWRTEMTDRMGISAAIVSALRDDRFVLYAQPTRSMADGSSGAYELLLRMHLEDGTLVLPDQIIPTAERLGLIRDIDRWVIRRALDMLADEYRAGRSTRFAVNMSGAAFSDPALLGIVKDALAETGVDASNLTIEITETSAIQDIHHAQRFIAELKAVGCRFALDDFGSGVSSFFYLKHLPVDDLKIDGSLVKNLGNSEADEHFLRAIVSMCKGLRIRTVAEYVETEALLAAVREIGVDYAQGYAIGYPAPFDPGPHGHA